MSKVEVKEDYFALETFSVIDAFILVYNARSVYWAELFPAKCPALNL